MRNPLWKMGLFLRKRINVRPKKGFISSSAACSKSLTHWKSQKWIGEVLT